MSSTKSFAKKHRQAINLSAFVATALAVTTSSTIVKAGTIRHDVEDSEYRNLANQFPSVGFLRALNSSGRLESQCSGTLINPSYVLTAAHCLEIENEFLTSGTFWLGNDRYRVNTAAVLQHPEWNGIGSDGNDIALLGLLDPVSSVQPATLFSGNDENGKVGTYVGFGRTGNGLTGADRDGGPDQKRAGQNIINIGSTNNGQDSLLFSDFSRPGTFELKNKGGKCLDVQWGNITHSKTPVWLYDCNGTYAQQWYQDGDQIKNIGGKALDVKWGDIDNRGTPVWIYDSNGTPAQQWTSPNFDDYGSIKNVGGKCLDVRWGWTKLNKTRIQIWNCNDTNAQKWKAYDLDLALDLEYQIAKGDSGGGLFIDGQLAGVNSFMKEKNGGSLLPDFKVDSTYLDSSHATRVSSFLDFIDDGMRSLANLEIATGFRSDAQPFGFSSSGFSFAQDTLAPDFDYFDESFQVTVIDNSDFEYLLSLNDNPVLNPTAPERVPEPSTTLSLLVVGVGAASILKRKRKNNSGN